MSKDRFTRDGSEALESRLHDTCREIARQVREMVPARGLQGLVLGGGYGRGEGGVLRRSGQEDAPYNDLEFFLFIKGPPRLNERRYGTAVEELGHRMTDRLGIEVEFKITSLEELAKGPTTMFYYDLVEGHRIFAGPDDLLAGCRHHAEAGRIPPSEAIRLLMNRFSGLLFAGERLAGPSFDRDDADFTNRNLAKARLALGDALLASGGSYHWSCRERHERLKKLELPALPLEELIDHHRQAVAFKLHPESCQKSREELTALHQKVVALAWVVWRFLEEKRLGMSFATPLAYTGGPNKCPETHPLKNALLRLRTFGLRGWLKGHPFRYPREALLNTLPLLLWDPSAADPARLSRELVTPLQSRAEAVAAYQKLWERYN